ncbi:MAG TPA: DUF58 domain-containing protein, partial [Bacteroidia bacterium]|nr:DUF58 domain-containing protein [Bacteroidia bacterium]
RLANKKHDIVALQIFDKRETELPDLGLLELQDSETGHRLIVDTSDAKVRALYKKNWEMNDKKLTEVFAKSGVDRAKVRTDQSYVQPLMYLFKKRGRLGK